MRTLSFALMGAAAATLVGCSSLEINNEQTCKNRQLDATTFEVEVMQAWVKDTVKIREEARKFATNFCYEKGEGMQPLQIISRTPAETSKGALARLTYRCVGYVEGPKREYQPIRFKLDSILNDEEMEKK